MINLYLLITKIMDHWGTANIIDLDFRRLMQLKLKLLARERVRYFNELRKIDKNII